jgi:HPt (histidine-containing phosphotransfer) domain-containing protein
MDDYITKPVSQSVLEQVLSRYCKVSARTSSFRPRRLLIVTSDRIVSDTVEQFFHQNFPECKIKVCPDGIRASLLLDGYRPDLIISELCPKCVEPVSFFLALSESPVASKSMRLAIRQPSDPSSLAADVLRAAVQDIIPADCLLPALQQLFASSQPPPPEPAHCVLDMQLALRSCMQDHELLRTAVELFLDVLHKDMDALRSAVASGQKGVVLSVSHGIKGAAATLGASEIRESALRLEQAAKTDCAEIDGLLIAALENAVSRFSEHVNSSSFFS